MNNLLAISWCFPPTIYPRSIQVSRLLAALADHDMQSDVVCVDPASLRPGQLLDETLNRPAGGRVRKYQVPSLEDWVLVRGLIRLFPSLGVLPDPKWVWKNAALRKSTRLAGAKKYDAIVSFAQPWTDHLIGLQLKEQTGLPWVAHFSDPWADSPYVNAPRWVMNKRLEMEKAVVRNADSVIFVSDQTASLVMRKYPADWQKKVSVIPHGFETIQETNNTTAQNPGKPLRMVYTGGFYGPRSPEPLLQAARLVGNESDYRGSFTIDFLGSSQYDYQKTSADLGLETCNFIPAVTHAVSQKACQSADVLLVIDAPSNTTNVFLPSKLVDYLAYNKPVLGISPPVGASADLLHELGFPVVNPEDIPGIAAAIRKLVDAKRQGKLSLPDSFPPIAEKYQIKHAAEKFDQVLRGIAGL